MKVGGWRVEGRLDICEGVKVGGCQEFAYYILSIPPLPSLSPSLLPPLHFLQRPWMQMVI